MYYQHLLDDCMIFGPRNEAIFDLIQALADKGMSLDEIESLLESALRLKLAEIEAASDAQT